MRRFALVWMAPPVLLAAVLLLPVIGGERAFFLRDVFSVHLEMRHALAAATGDGIAAGIAGGIESAAAADAAPDPGLLVDPYRGGGQAALYNPNTVGLYPTALAHRVLPFFAAFNLHLWLHLLLAPFTLYWLARELGLGRRGAWAAGVAWGFSGFLVSQLAFYNLVAGVVLAPALAAATVRWCRLGGTTAADPRQSQGTGGGRLRRAAASPAAALVAAGLLWALLVTGGDPQTAVVALAGAGGLALAEPGRRRSLPWLAAAVAAGTLVALPQVVGLLTILPASARGAGWGEAMRGAGSLDPRQAVGWLLPFADGRPDLVGPGGFWGYRFHQGSWPFYFTLYPGLATLALLVAAGLPRRLRPASVRGWWLIAAGTFFALGAFNPLVAALLSLPGLDTLRYPLKFWLLAAMGGALVAGVGFARAFGDAAGGRCEPELTDAATAPPQHGDGAGGRRAEDGGSESGEIAHAAAGHGESGAAPSRAPRRRALAVLLALAACFGVAWLLMRFVPATAGALHELMLPGTPAELAEAERLRWAGLALVSAGAALALAAAAHLAGRRPVAGGVLLLTLHAGLQLFLLRPALVTEPTAPYRQAPPILAAVPADALVAHASFEGLFGSGPMESGDLPAPEVRWVFRRTFVEAYPFAGALHGRRYDLDPSPEGLDTAALERAVEAVEAAPDDATRLRLLAAWGITHVLTPEPLELGGAGGAPASLAAPDAGLAERVASERSVHRRIHAYRLTAPAPGVYLATGRLQLAAGSPAGAAEAAASLLAHPRFRAGRDVVLAPEPGAGDEAASAPAPGGRLEVTADPGGAPGRVRVVAETAERLEAETAAGGPGVLVWQRARLPMHRAWVDGEEVAPRTVNLYRLGVPVPPGEHRVRVEVDRRPLHLSAAGSAVGLTALLALGFAAWRRGGATATA